MHEFQCFTHLSDFPRRSCFADHNSPRADLSAAEQRPALMDNFNGNSLETQATMAFSIPVKSFTRNRLRIC